MATTTNRVASKGVMVQVVKWIIQQLRQVSIKYGIMSKTWVPTTLEMFDTATNTSLYVNNGKDKVHVLGQLRNYVDDEDKEGDIPASILAMWPVRLSQMHLTLRLPCILNKLTPISVRWPIWLSHMQPLTSRT